MQIVPIAVTRQDEKTLLLWDPNPESGLLFPTSHRSFMDYHWGAGAIDGRTCLVLYMFGGEHAIELYFPQTLKTTPDRDIDVWDALLGMQPERFGLRYGEDPGDDSRAALLSFELHEEKTVSENLTDFLDRIITLYDNGERDPLVAELVEYFRPTTGDSCPIQL